MEKTTAEKIQVMQAYQEGKQIEFRYIPVFGYPEWRICNFEPDWDWLTCDYRVKPEPSYEPYSGARLVLEDMIKHHFECVDKNSRKLYKVSIEGVGYVSLIGVSDNLVIKPSYEVFLEGFTWLDGSACGVPVNRQYK